MNLNEHKTIIVFGGSFDPPHLAHVKLPIVVKQRVDADLVLYVPSGVGAFKRYPPPTAAHHRLSMLRLALEGLTDVDVLTDEIDRAANDRHTVSTGHPTAPDDPQPTYTVDTLESLRQRLDRPVQLRLLIGADHLKTFDQWHRADRVIALAQPLVMVRPPETRETALAALPARFDRRWWADRLVEVPQMDISSSRIRHLAGAGKSLAGLTPPSVEAYIKHHGLYTDLHRVSP